MGGTAYYIRYGPRNTVLGRCLVLFKHFKSSSPPLLLFYFMRDLLNKMAYVAPLVSYISQRASQGSESHQGLLEGQKIEIMNLS